MFSTCPFVCVCVRTCVSGEKHSPTSLPATSSYCLRSLNSDFGEIGLL